MPPMDDPIDIAQLRADARTLDFCQQVSPTCLARFANLLYAANPPLSLHDLNSVLASIGNILLLNRSLDFLAVKEKLLAFLNAFCRRHILTPEKFRYHHLIPAFRLYFLLGIDKSTPIDPEVRLAMLRVLHDTVDAFRVSCPAGFPDDKFRDLISELVKALLNEYVHDPTTIPPGFRKKYMKSHARLLEKGLPISNGLMRNVLNILMISFSNSPVQKSEISQDLHEYTKFVLALIDLLSRTQDISQAENIAGAISTYAFLLEILQVLISAPGGDDSHLVIHKLMRDKMLPYNDPTVFQNCLRFLAAEQGQHQMPFAFSTSNSCLRQLILKFYYLLCFRWSETRTDAQVREYIDLFGYILARRVLSDQNAPLPADLDLSTVMQPNPQYLLVHLHQQPLSIATVFNDAYAHANNPAAKQVPEMTQEEKEAEAEKLFVLFDRMEKLGTFKGFKNPVRKHQ